jgi:hypothetical protein
MTQPDTVPFDFFDFVWLRIDEDGEKSRHGPSYWHPLQAGHHSLPSAMEL